MHLSHCRSFLQSLHPFSYQIHSFTAPSIPSSLHPFSHTSIHCLTPPSILSHSSVHSFTPPSIVSPLHPFSHPSIHSLSSPSILSALHPVSQPSIHSLSSPSILTPPSSLSHLHPFSHSLHPFSPLHPVSHATVHATDAGATCGIRAPGSCFGTSYDAAGKAFCCSGNVYPCAKPANWACCGKMLVDRNLYLCCSNDPFPKGECPHHVPVL